MKDFDQHKRERKQKKYKLETKTLACPQIIIIVILTSIVGNLYMRGKNCWNLIFHLSTLII